VILSQKDLTRLEGLHIDLVKVVRLAAEKMPADLGFMITEGLRTAARQAQLVAAGASQTMRSRHLTGHAVDLAPLLDGGPRWDWPLCYRVADVVADAARELHISLEWGGCWDRTVQQWHSPAHEESEGYANRRRAAGHKAFLDGPHFQLPASEYP
jgi:peptidoglycan L-alanyl-D-glutamate endopeptidase CwlK